MTKAEIAKCIAEGKDIAVSPTGFTKATLWRYGVPPLTRCTPLAADTPRVDHNARFHEVKLDGIRVKLPGRERSTTIPDGRDLIPVLREGRRHIIGDDFAYEATSDRVVDPRRIVCTWEQFEADRAAYADRKTAEDRLEADDARAREEARRAAAALTPKLKTAGFDSAHSDNYGRIVLSHEDAARLLALSETSY